MRSWWPVFALEKWRRLSPTRRARARIILEHLELRFRGGVIGQTRLVRSLQREKHQSYGPTVETIHALVEVGLLRRKAIGRTVVIWVPEFLLEQGCAADVEDLLALRASRDAVVRS